MLLWFNEPVILWMLSPFPLGVLRVVCGPMVMYFTQVMLGSFFNPEPSVTLTLVSLPHELLLLRWWVVAC